jgi:glutamate synthase domain-containing protein 1
MCGIVGLFSKSPSVEARLGELVSGMLVEMTDRGPDSAGLAIYHDPVPAGATKLSLFSAAPDYPWATLARGSIDASAPSASVASRASHAVMSVATDADQVEGWIARAHPELRVMSAGSTIETYKEMGSPRQFVERFGLRGMQGTHAVGHTRMATESVVTTEHSHPFSTGLDLCLVHNGSLSNHNRLRDRLRRQGVPFATDNDSEVAAGYLTWRLREGDSLDQALEAALQDLDGFYTFAIGTRDGFAVLRDPIGCKPAVMAETADWVAIASEFRAIATLPGVEEAKVWEPAPGQIYSWSRN